MTIQFNGRTAADVKALTVRGHSGLGYQALEFTAEVHGRASAERLSLIGLCGEVSVIGQSGQGFLGQLSPKGPQSFVFPDYRSTTETLLRVTGSQIEKIEEIRNGGPLTFTVNLSGLAVGTQNLPEAFCENLHFAISQSDWLGVLGSLKYSRTFLLEIPLLEEACETEPNYFSHLQDAMKAMHQGNWRESVGCCRDALESLSTALGETQDDHLMRKAQDLIKGSRSWDMPQRLRAVRIALFSVAAAARHSDEVGQSIDWSRSDAQSVIALTANLIRRACTMVNQRPPSEG
jgi:hypothetical protein